MKDKIKVGLIGAGKMGISHLSILGIHPQVEIVGVCDESKILTDSLSKYSGFKCFSNYKELINLAEIDAVFIAVPTRLHAEIIKAAIERGLHIFSEKPFVLKLDDGRKFVTAVKEKKLINQVGYHNRFLGTFNEAKKIIDSGVLGNIIHFEAEAYGPVVTKKKNSTWRSKPEEGGGCLMDYASHVVDLVHFLISPLKEVMASIVKPIYSKDVDDAVYAMLRLQDLTTGILSVNWSDETYRKMSTSIAIHAENGKIICDANELKVYLKKGISINGYEDGWTIKYLTELTSPVDFYLRGEEYSLQIDHFINQILGKTENKISSFETAIKTDEALEMILNASKK
ncbi:MAG: Gfo/Idh/MocA family oxidoreductase [Pelobium sp.]